MLRKLFIIVITLFILFAVYQFAKKQGLLPNQIFSQIENKIPDQITLPWQKNQKIEVNQINFKKEDLEKIGANGLSQIKILSQKAKESGELAKDFIEEVVKVDEDKDKNLSEKAFEYGRYIYCQEVVKQYEASGSSSTNF